MKRAPRTERILMVRYCANGCGTWVSGASYMQCAYCGESNWVPESELSDLASKEEP